MKFSASLFASLLALLVCSYGVISSAMILPPNHFNIYDNHVVQNVTEQQFNTIVDSIVAAWKPIAAAHGAQLVATKDWNDSTVNAFADQKGNLWEVHFFGGLARRPEITPDGFALVVCHELGHHFGGYYFYGNSDWAAAEGQADYFATQMCGRRIFQSFQSNRRYWSVRAPDPVKDDCHAVWGKNPQAEAQCFRISAGGLALAKLLAVVGGSKTMPSFSTPDPSKVSKTNTEHPEAQCRLDTYFNGALCSVNLPPDLIPGKGTAGGNNSPAAEAIANKVSCAQSAGFKIGMRPRCWFMPQL